MAFLMDTGFWYATLDSSDEHHAKVVSIARNIRQNIFIPIPVITETAYLILKNQGVGALARFAENLSVTKFQL